MFRSVCLSLLLLSQGCDLFGGKRGHGDRAEHKRGEGKTEATDGLGAPVEKTDGRLRVTEGPADFTAQKTVSAPETVVFIVMDTVRADHLSLCGYDRPTTPFLQKLVADKHAAVTCKAYAPATWTTPSHASYFTGAPATEHNLLNKGHGLPREFETLAETYAFAGWQTAMISANPTLGRATGTWQGFQYAIAAEGLYKAWRGQDLVHQVGKALDQADPTKKLFLFVNVFDAHDPYPAVPENVPWLPKRERLDILPTRPEAPQEIKDFVKGSIEDAARADIVARMIDGYDFGVSKADTTVQKVLGLIEDKGYFNRPYRVIITSDHGEHLGEHNMIRHDGPPWDAVANVPVIFIDSTVTTPPVFPDPMSSLSVYSLLKDGVMPGTPLPVASAAIRYDEEPDPSNAWFKDSVAVWNADHTKQIWIEGKVSQFNLATDPHELAPQDLAAGSPALDAGVEAMKKSKQIALAQAKDPEVMKMLEAVGYVN